MSETFRALVLEEGDPAPTATIKDLGETDLPAGEVTVAVEYSDLNYKDGMVIKGLGRLVRQYPHVPGIDFAGTVTASADDRFAPGDKVVLTGWRVGEVHWGGYAQRARVKADWLVPLPGGLDTRRAMAVGTAGLTAALALIALEEHGLTPEAEGDLLVTGAAGGLGSIAVALAAARGYRVVAATGRPETRDYLTSLGAQGFVDRTELSEGKLRPLDSERWVGCIDSVGSSTLAKVLSQLHYGRAAAACGLAGGADLPAMVVPFLLRGVSLLGIDSVMCPIPRREAAWARIAEDLPAATLDAVTEVVPLDAVTGLADEILAGRTRGRVVVDVNA
ncbi:MAG: acryloyl-CoA reductase [Alphaproteobacteria bacterium]|nr:acryloyl-CoA reductase [Alphaproteobacteria bacterium]